MEDIYLPEHYKASHHLDLKKYFKEYNELCPQSKLASEVTQSDLLKLIQQEMNQDADQNLHFDLEEVKNLEEMCSIDKLQCEGEREQTTKPTKLGSKTKIDIVYPISSQSENLEVVQCKQLLEKSKNFSQIFFNKGGVIKTSVIESNKTIIKDIQPGSEFIFTIILYKPFNVVIGQKKNAQLYFDCEFEALGTNTLAELSDKIDCPSDRALHKEVENTNQVEYFDTDAKELYPSRFFFIDGVFYNDMRLPQAVDHSSVYIEWAKDKKIGKFKSDLMDKTTLDSLQPRIGYPYVFVHQGECEHILVFSDARLLQNNDCLYTKMYPRICKTTRTSNILCFLCSSTHAQWVCTECDRFPQEKVFLCTDCCNSYNFIGDKKVGHFKLYPYFKNNPSTPWS